MNSETKINTGLRPRPLSPHLQVYSWLMSNTTSILHRLTGVVLSFGILLISAWLVVAAYYPESYDEFQEFLESPFGLIPLIGFSLAYIYHMLNGIRHLAWDAGYGYDIRVAKKTGYIVFILTAILTALLWVIALEIV